MKPFETASGLLRDRTGETANGLLSEELQADRPPFQEPWQARVFALAVHLNEQGVFEWAAFSTTLGAHLAQSHDGNYYRCWHAALTDVLEAVGVRGLSAG